MTRTITNEAVVGTYADGRKAVFILPVIPDDAPAAIREGLARRRIAAFTGECPCGNVATISRQQRRALHRRRDKAKTRGTPIRATLEHESGCPAPNSVLVPLLRAWIAGGSGGCRDDG